MKICIVRLSALGDIIHSMIVLQFIKKHYPDSRIDWVVSDCFKDILLDHPDIDRVHPLFPNGARRLRETLKKLRELSRESFDFVIDMQGLLKSAVISRMIGSHPWGFSKHSSRERSSSLFYKHTVAVNYKENIYIRNLALLSRALQFEFSEQDIQAKRPYLGLAYSQNGLPDGLLIENKKTIVVIPSATTPERVVPPLKYAELINKLDCRCLLTWGNAGEKASAESIAAHSHAEVVPRLCLRDLIALIARTDLVIGPDTGPSNIPFALNKPSITLFWNGARNSHKRNSFETGINKSLSFADMSAIDADSIAKLACRLIHSS